MRILSVAEDGRVQGTFFVSGTYESVARIVLSNRNRLEITNATGSTITLTRSSDGLALEGSLVSTTKRSYPIVMGKTTAVGCEPASHLARRLVGQWEGNIVSRFGVRPEHNRTLYVDSVNDEQGLRVAFGRWGVTGRRPGRVRIDVAAIDRAVTLRFDDGGNNHIELDLVSDDTALLGGFRVPGAQFTGSKGASEDHLRLRRVY